MNPEDLRNQCLTYIQMYLEQFPTSYLALLPLAIRKELLYCLPVADRVQLLDDTWFSKGFDVHVDDYFSEERRQSYYGSFAFLGKQALVGDETIEVWDYFPERIFKQYKLKTAAPSKRQLLYGEIAQTIV